MDQLTVRQLHIRTKTWIGNDQHNLLFGTCGTILTPKAGELIKKYRQLQDEIETYCQ